MKHTKQIINRLSNDVKGLKRYIRDSRLYVRMYRDQMEMATFQLKALKLRIYLAQVDNDPEGVSYYAREQNIYKFQYNQARDLYLSQKQELRDLHTVHDDVESSIRELYKLME